MRLYYCDQQQIALPAGHKFPIAKYRLLRERLEAEGGFTLVPAPFASREQLERAHDPAYVASILDGTVASAVMRRIGFPWSEGLVRRTLASVGGTLAAAADAMACGIGGTLAGGTHHAFRSEGAGFCVFNDLAVAIRNLRKRAAVVDLDVHQGDGTAAIFSGDLNILTLSLHGSNNFPFRKQAGSIDISLPDGVADDDYLSALDQVLPRVWDFSPEIVFYQSGVDALAEDTLGRLSLTHDGLRRRDSAVIEGCRRRAIPLVITLGGGYGNPIESTVRSHMGTFLLARNHYALTAPAL